MSLNKKILICMPAYNESKVIGKVIKDIQNEGFKNILVVDDCSSDQTFKVAIDAGAIVIKHVINRGAGAATATGIKYAKDKNYDYLVLIDSDGQHNPKDIKKLLEKANKKNVVIGSRMISNLNQMPIQRKIANFIGSILTWVFFGLFVWDSQSGFKIFNKKAINSIKITFDRYEFCSEIIGEIKKNKLSFIEVPIKVHYSSHSMEKGHGQSIFNGFKMIFRFIKYKFGFK